MVTTNQDENEIKNLKNQINILNERVLNLENKLEKMINDNNTNLNGFTNKIIKTKEEVKELLNYICNGRERQFNLLYTAKIGENTKEDFHKYCDNKGSTIILVETTNGRRFGGFTSLSWKKNDSWINDPCSFIFSLDNHKKYKLLLPQYSYWCGAGYGPHFGYCDQLGFYNAGSASGFLDAIHNMNFGTKTYDIPSPEEITLTGSYIMHKFEVYQVI